MNRTVKRYLMGLIASATMFGTARAQDDGPVGAVQLGTQAQVPVQSPAVVPQPTDVQSNVPLAPGAQGFPTPPMPPMAGMSQVGQPGSPGYGNYFNTTPVDTVIQPRFIVNSYGGGLYGYNAGYANIGAFLPYKIDDTAIVFATGMGMATYDGRGGGTVGAGWRYYMEDLDRIVGLSVFGDFDNGHNQPYQQVGFSFESLGRYIDYRVNGYVPVSNANHVLNVNQTTNASLIGNNIGLLQYQTIEQSYSGFDAELGGPTPLLGRYGLNAYIGGYSFSGNGTQGGNFQGVSGRLLAQINEDVSFGVQVTDDHVFGLNTQFQVFATLPGGRPSRWMRNLRVQDRMVQNVFRQNRVIANTGTIASYVTAINPTTNKPYFVANINPNLNSSVIGNGSVTNPFSSIAQYESQTTAQQQQYNIIYVRPRTDGTHTNLDTASTLDIYNGQRLLSTSIVQSLVTSNLPGTTINMPGFTGGALPTIYNSSGGNVVTLVGGNTQGEQVSGFNIVGSLTGNGIFGNNNTAVNISNNTIQQGLNGVLLTNLAGTIASNLSTTVATNPSGTVATNLSGSSASNLSGTITSGTNPQLNGTTLSTGVSSTSLTGGVNLVNLNGTFVRVSTGTESQFFNNTFKNNYGNGLQITNKAQPPLELVAQGNTFSSNGTVTLPVGTVLTALQLSQIANLSGTVSPQTNGTTIVTVPTSDGMRIDALAGSSIAGIIGGSNTAATSTTGAFNQLNTFSGNTGNGLDLQANGGTLNFMNSTQPTLTPFGIIGNTFTSNGSGITAAQSTTLISQQLNNTFGGAFAGNGFDGLHINTTNNSIANFNVISNTFGSATNTALGNKEYGIGLSSDSGNTQINIGGSVISSTGVVTNLGNNFFNNDISAINLAATGTAALAYNISNNSITNGSTASTPVPQDSFTFTFDGTSGTAPFVITNTSATANADITSVVWNLAATPATIAASTVLNPVVVQPINSSLLTSLNNVAVQPGTQPLLVTAIAGGRANNANTGLAAGSTSLPLGFTGFAPGDIFKATSLFTQAGGGAALTSAATAGSTVTVTFSNGGLISTETLALQPAVSNVAVGASGTVFGTSTPGFGNGGDGIHVSATDNATLNTLAYDSFTFSFNGTSGTTPFTITNNSESGVTITNLNWNLNPTNAVIGLNTSTAVVQPASSSLLTQLNGSNVASGTTPLLMASPSPASGLIANNTNAGIPAGSQLLGLGFINPTTNTSSFTSGTTFSATSLLNPRGSSSALSSLGTVGSTLTVKFSDGVVETANVLPNINFQNPTSPLAAVTATASGFSVAPAGSSDPTIYNNTVTGYGGYGIHVQTALNAIDSNLVIQNNKLSSNGTGVSGAGIATFTGGGLELDRHDSSYLNAIIASNTVSSNFNNGIAILADGTTVGGLIVNSHDNIANTNAANGLSLSTSGAAILSLSSNRDNFDSNGSGSSNNAAVNGGDNISLTTTGTSVANVTLNNVSANSSSSNGLTSAGTATGNGLSATTSNTSALNLVIDSPADPLYSGNGSTFSNNKLNGILFNSNDDSYMHANLFGRTSNNTLVNGNGQNGIAYNRTGASLVLSNISNTTITSNALNGISFKGAGGDPTDPSQIFSGQANTINLANDTIATNGTLSNGILAGDGIYASLLGQSVLVLNATSTAIQNNVANGVDIVLEPGAGFGYSAGNVASTFDAVTITGNGANGIMFSSYSSASLLTQIGDPLSTTDFTLNSVQGNSYISNNGANGILAQYENGIHTININGDGNTTPVYGTFIQANGQNGILTQVGIDASLTMNIAGDTGGNDILIGGPSAANSNKGDGINFQATSLITIQSYQTPNSLNTFTYFDFTAGVASLNVSNTMIQNNVGNGITLLGDGLSAAFATGTNYLGVVVPFISDDGAGQLNANVTNSTIINNGLNGVNVNMIGNLAGNNLTFTNNTIASNGNSGFFMQANAGEQLRNTNGALFIEQQFFNPPTNPGTIPLNPQNYVNFGGNTFIWNTGLNVNNVAGAGEFSNWMNVLNDQSTNLKMYGNAIQYNGTKSGNAAQLADNNLNPSAIVKTYTYDGVHISVGTDTYLSADIGGAAGNPALGNVISGNVHTDVFMNSFLSYNPATGQAPVPGSATTMAATFVSPATVSVNAGSATGLSTVFLDDTAQLDLRFNNNTGNTVTILSPFPNLIGVQGGAIYPHDPVKDIYFLGSKGNSGAQRLTQLFEVDNGSTLDLTNSFISNGANQSLVNTFSNASWYLRTVADPLFPNASFPQAYSSNPPASQGNPFLP